MVVDQIRIAKIEPVLPQVRFALGFIPFVHAAILDCEPPGEAKPRSSRNRTRAYLIQKHGAIERIALDGLEARIADDAAQLFFGGAVTGARGFDDILF